MLKRKNPFGDSSPLQLKTHVSQTIVDQMNGASDPSMQKIYGNSRILIIGVSFSTPNLPQKIKSITGDHCQKVSN